MMSINIIYSLRINSKCVVDTSVIQILGKFTIEKKQKNAIQN